MKNGIGRFLGIAFLILLAAGAQPAISAVWQWSKTSTQNATADPSINWAEGMSPSSVNDSARAMMSAVAEFRDDISGLIATGGTSTAYTATSNSNLCPISSTPNDGQQISVTTTVSNGINPTLAIDGCAAAPIQSAPGVSVPAATLLAGNPYKFKYSVANTAWMLHGFYGSAISIPLGGMMPYTATTVPNSNFVFPAGQCLSTTTYAAYWALIGSPASGSCPGGQFQIIDLSGRVPAGLDTMPGFSAANRLTSSSTGCGTAMTTIGAVCSNGRESQPLVFANIPTLPLSVSGSVSGSFGTNIPSAAGAAWSNNSSVNIAGSSGVFPQVNSAIGNVTGLTSSGTLTGSAGNASPSGVANVPPLVGVTYLLRVL